MVHKILSLFAIIIVSMSFSQTIPKTENICFFQDGKTGKPITIVNDSLIYKGELKNPGLLKHTDYPGILNRYTHYNFNIKKHTYLVELGCGPVLEYRNDSLIRIDNSVLQNNQFGASPFIFKGQICLFGGYGLFTDKNIITRFDFTSKEWFLLNNKGEDIPSARNASISYFDKDGLYIFGGWSNKTIPTFEKDLSIWYFNFKTLQWIRLGNYNETLLKIISKFPYYYNTFQTKSKLYLQDIESIVEIDFKNNTIRYFENKNIICNIKPYFDNNSNALVYLQNLNGSSQLKLETISLSDLLKKPIKTEKLYYSRWQENLLSSFYILFPLFLLYLIFRWKNHKKGNHFVYNQSKNKLYYKSKIISNLDPLEEKIMFHLLQNTNSFIQLNQLNFIFEKENQGNFTNLIKKRDLVFSSLSVKLNAFVIRGEETLFIIQKNEVDKRIKEIKLNPLYFTLK
jgi:hypothetical protein